MRGLLGVGVCAVALLVAACSDGDSDNRTELVVQVGAASGAFAEDGGALNDAGAADASGRAVDSSAGDAPLATPDANADSGSDCEWGGAPGSCMAASACAAIPDHSSYPDECPGPAAIQCCMRTPSTEDNPPVPAGWMLMEQSQVTAAMTTWAVDILDEPQAYPMFATTMMTFGTLLVLARVEWHAPDFQNDVVHRGVTLYEESD